MSKSAPLYNAFTVRKAQEEGKKDIWINIGAAWPHRDEKGLDVVLDALPVDGHVVLRLNEPRFDERRTEKPAAERKPYAKQAPRGGNERRSVTPAKQSWKRR